MKRRKNVTYLKITEDYKNAENVEATNISQNSNSASNLNNHVMILFYHLNSNTQQYSQHFKEWKKKPYKYNI